MAADDPRQAALAVAQKNPFDFYGQLKAVQGQEATYKTNPNDQTLTSSRVDQWGNPYDPLHPTAGQQYSPYTKLANPTVGEWGGQRGGAEAEQSRYQQMGAAAQGRTGPQIDPTQYNADRGMEDTDRARQTSQLGALGATLNGTAGPSVAQQQLGAGLAQARAQQASLAAGARGGGANLAAARQDAVEAGATLGGQAANQSRLLKAQEWNAALGNAGSALNQRRIADLQRQGLSADQAANQAKLEMDQRGRNDALQQGYEALAHNVGTTQLGARERAEALNAGQTDFERSLAAQQMQFDLQRSNQMTQGMLGIGTGLAGTAIRGKPNPNDNNG